MDYFILIFRLIFALVVVFGFMIITLRYSNKGMAKLNEKKYVKVIDRIQISKDSFIVILKIGDSGLVVLTSTNHTETLKKLSKEEVEKLEKDKKENYEEMTQLFSKVINKGINKIRLKEKNDEKI